MEKHDSGTKKRKRYQKLKKDSGFEYFQTEKPRKSEEISAKIHFCDTEWKRGKKFIRKIAVGRIRTYAPKGNLISSQTP